MGPDRARANELAPVDANSFVAHYPSIFVRSNWNRSTMRSANSPTRIDGKKRVAVARWAYSYRFQLSFFSFIAPPSITISAVPVAGFFFGPTAVSSRT
jgi:hypothetical protein